MSPYVIEPLDLADYEKCNNIWDMASFPLTEVFRQEIESGRRFVFICKINGEFIGEVAYVPDNGDPDYTIPGKRVYISRLIVKQEYRNHGIGGILIDHILKVVRSLGYTEASIGVDKDNLPALHLYRRKGFTTVLFDGEDADGAFYKLLKVL